MGRSQNDSGLFEKFESSLRECRWWGGPIVIGFAFAMFYWIIPLMLPWFFGGSQLEQQMVRLLGPFSIQFAPFAAILMSMVWISSLIRR